MKRLLLASALTLSAFLPLHAALDEGEVRFRSRAYQSSRKGSFKAYKPSRAFEDKAYRSRSYRPSRDRVQIFKRAEAKPYTERKGADDLPVYVGKAQDEELFRQKKEEIRVRSIPADPRASNEKKPLISNKGELAGKAYKNREKGAHSKNPLLAPRQGIKDVAPDAK